MNESRRKRRTYRVPSPRPSPCIFKAQVQDLVYCCAPPSGSEQCLCSGDEPAEPHMLCDPWPSCSLPGSGLARAPSPLASASSSCLHTKTLRERERATELGNKGCSCWSSLFEVSLSLRGLKRADTRLMFHQDESADTETVCTCRPSLFLH